MKHEFMLLGHTEPGLAGSLPTQLPGHPLPVGPVLLLPVLPLAIFLKLCFIAF